MERAILHAEYDRLATASDIDGMAALLPLIKDTDPRAAQMLNCIGHGLCVAAKTQRALQEGVSVMERAMSLAQDEVLKLKIFVSMAAFSIWGISPARAAEMARQALGRSVPPEYAHMQGLGAYYLGFAHAMTGEFEQATCEAARSLTFPLAAKPAQGAHILLASMAARRGDSKDVDFHLGHALDAEYVPYVDGVRARLALTLGAPQEAAELAQKSIQGFSAMPVRLATWPAMLAAREIYAEALSAAGDVEAAVRAGRVLAGMNGGFEYAAKWGGI